MDDIAQNETFVAEGRTLAAERGWSWIAEGWALFRRQPGVWIVMILLLAVIFFVATLIPFIGSLAMAVLFPVFTAGLVIGSRSLDTGGGLEFGHLFAGFHERFAPLATVGAIYLAGTVVIALVVGLITGASMFAMMGGTPPADPAGMAGAAASMLLALLVMLALMIPLAMAVWFAPPLVVFHNLNATDAMKASFAGCLKNIVPFLVYGVILFVAAIIASVPLGLGWLILGPVMAASVYTAYRDVYFTR